MFFRKKVTVSEFASLLIGLHAQRFSYRSLLQLLDKGGTRLKIPAQQTLLSNG